MMALPLKGVRVLVGRAAGQEDDLVGRLTERGAHVIHEPLLTIEPGDEAGMDGAVDDLANGTFAALALTSPNGVRALEDALRRGGLDAAVVRNVDRIACVGPGTAAALTDRLDVAPDLVPDIATTIALAEAFPPGTGRVLLPRADQANPALSEILATKGYEPVDVVAYRTRAPERLSDEVQHALVTGGVDVIAFASSSTVRHFVALAPAGWRAKVVSIGPVTSTTCTELGVPVAVEADPHDLNGLVDAIVDAAAP